MKNYSHPDDIALNFGDNAVPPVHHPNRPSAAQPPLDPCRPIDTRVVPAKFDVPHFDTPPDFLADFLLDILPSFLPEFLPKNAAHKGVKQTIKPTFKRITQRSAKDFPHPLVKNLPESLSESLSELLPELLPQQLSDNFAEPMQVWELLWENDPEISGDTVSDDEGHSHKGGNPAIWVAMLSPAKLANTEMMPIAPTADDSEWQAKLILPLPEFLATQQLQRQTTPFAPLLPLSFLPKLLANTPIAWLQNVVQQHPKHYRQPCEDRLFIMAEMYHNMLCVLLLCQCKARTTINAALSLQGLSEHIRHYVSRHAHEIVQFSPDYHLNIKPKHVQFAALALGWKVTLHSNIAERQTCISAQNPLTHMNF